MNFKGENRVIALIENDNLEHENNYEENGIINYEVNSKKSKDRIKNYYNWPMITLQYEKLFEDTSLLFRTSAI